MRTLLPLMIMIGILGCTSTEQKNHSMLEAENLNSHIQHLADSLQATIAVSFYDLETGQKFHFDDKQMMHAASTMKVPVMIELYRQAERGAFALDDSITIKNEFRSIVDSSLFSISDDSEETLYARLGEQERIRTLMELMITWSSNLATNLMIELVDAKKVTATMRELGAEDIQVLRGVEDLKAYRKGWNNRTNAYDMMVIMRAIAENQAASAASCKEMIEVLKKQHFREKIPAGVPEDIAVASKTGAITAIDHDCAIVFPKNRKPYVLVVLTKGIPDQAQASAAIASISEMIYSMLVTATTS